jgi:hypothetical protein
MCWLSLLYEIAEQVGNSLRVIKPVESLNFVGKKKWWKIYRHSPNNFQSLISLCWCNVAIARFSVFWDIDYLIVNCFCPGGHRLISPFCHRLWRKVVLISIEFLRFDFWTPCSWCLPKSQSWWCGIVPRKYPIFE